MLKTSPLEAKTKKTLFWVILGSVAILGVMVSPLLVSVSALPLLGKLHVTLLTISGFGGAMTLFIQHSLSH